jgi:hypothetical protein
VGSTYKMRLAGRQRSPSGIFVAQATINPIYYLRLCKYISRAFSNGVSARSKTPNV